MIEYTIMTEMKTKLIILGVVGLSLVGGVAYGIKKIAELVDDDYDADCYDGCDFIPNDD